MAKTNYSDLTPLELLALKNDMERNYDVLMSELENDKEYALEEMINGRGPEITEARNDYKYAEEQMERLMQDKNDLEDAYNNSLKM